MGLGNSYATFDETTGYTTEANIHIGGTIPRGSSVEFWLTRPRPSGVDDDEWERQAHAQWDRIFPKHKGERER